MNARQLIEQDDKDEVLVGSGPEHVCCGESCEICGEACTLMHRPGERVTQHICQSCDTARFNNLLDRL